MKKGELPLWEYLYYFSVNNKNSTLSQDAHPYHSFFAIKIIFLILSVAVGINGLCSAGMNLSMNPSYLNFPGYTITALAWGDIDGDGDLDLAVGTDGQGDMVLPNNNGVISETPIWRSTPHTKTTSLAWGDFDRDGDLDLAVGTISASGGAQNLIYKNIGGQYYLETTPSWASTDSSKTYKILWADINNDGYLDLIAGNQGEPVRIYFNRAGGSGRYIENTASWATFSNYYTRDIAVGNLDGDAQGYLEMVVATINSQRNYIFVRDQNNELQKSPTYSTHESVTFGVCLGDIDANGQLDIAFANFNEPDEIYMNPTLSKFPTEPTWTSQQTLHSTCIAMADVDMDNDLEMAIGTWNSEYTYVYWYDSSQHSMPETTNWQSTDAGYNSSIAFGDYDGDGDLDMAISNRGGNICLYKNNELMLSNGGIGKHAVRNTTAGIYSYINNNSIPDFIEAVDNDKVFIYFDAPPTPFPGWTSGSAYNISDIAVADYDNDGDYDIACAVKDGQEILFRNTGSGTFIPSSPSWSSADSENQVETTSVSFGDINRDGIMDLAFGENGGKARVFIASSTGGFNTTPDWLSASSYNTKAVLLYDVTGDGKPELILGNYGQKNVIFKNEGGQLQENPIWISDRIDNTTSITVADVNCDSYPDLIFTNFEEENVIYYNTGAPGGDNTFPKSPNWTSNDTLKSNRAVVGDFLVNGYLDLAVANGTVGTQSDFDVLYTSTSACALRNNYSWYTSNSSDTRLACAIDEDMDGDLDLLYGIYNGVNLLFKSRYTPNSFLLLNNPAYGYIVWDVGDTQLAPPIIHTGLTKIKFKLFDKESDPCYIQTFYSENGGVVWKPATLWTGPKGEYQSLPNGKEHTIIWDTDADKVNNENVLFKVRIFSYPSKVGEITRWAFDAVSPPMRIKAVPELTFRKPAANGSDNTSVLLDYEISEQCEVKFIFEWTGGNYCPGLIENPEVTHYKESGGIRLPLPSAAGRHRVTIDGEDLYADGSITTNDKLCDGGLYTVHIEVCDLSSHRNCRNEAHLNWEYDKTPPILNAITLMDNKAVSCQPEINRYRYTNSREIWIKLDMPECKGDRIFFTENLIYWGQGRTFDGCQYTYTLISGDRNATVYCKVEDDAGNVTEIRQDSIILDTLYRVMNCNTTLKIGDGGTYFNEKDLTARWAGCTEPYDPNPETPPPSSGFANSLYRSTTLFGKEWYCLWNRSFNLTDLPDGWFDFSIRYQDNAGNRTGVLKSAWSCVDTQKPSWKGDEEWICIEDCQPFSNKSILKIDWGKCTDDGCAGFKGYELKYYVNGEEYPSDPINNPSFWVNPPSQWINPPQGELKVCVTCIDQADNRSQKQICDTIRSDSVPPKIWFAGYGFTDITCHNGGPLNIMALVTDTDVAYVRLYTLDPKTKVLNPQDVYLVDDGTSGDFIAGDHLYMIGGYVAKSAPIISNFLICLKAVDWAGNESEPWPFLNVKALSPTLASISPPDFSEIMHIDGLSLFGNSPLTFEQRIVYEDFLRKLRDILDIQLHQREEKSAEGKAPGRPMILAAGFCDTDISFESGGNLHMQVVAIGPNFPNYDPLCVQLGYYKSFNRDFCVPDDGSMGDGVPLDFIHSLKTPIAPFILPIGKDYTPYPWKLGFIGGYLIEAIAETETGEVSNIWPYFSINYVPIAVSCDASPNSGQPGAIITFNGSAQYGRPYYDANTGRTWYKEYIWNFGDNTPPYISTESPFTTHSYSREGEFTATLTVKDQENLTGSCTTKIKINICQPGMCELICGADQTYFPEAPAKVNFDMSGFCCDLVSCSWDFGDPYNPGSSNSCNASHTYSRQGVYVTHGSAVSNTGKSLGCDITIVVGATIPVCEIFANPTYGPAPLSVAFTSTVQGGTPSYTYLWNFGDGQTSTEANPVHTYQNPGEYDATLTVTDSTNPPQQTTCGPVHIRVSGAECDHIASARTELKTDCSGGTGAQNILNLVNVKAGDYLEVEWSVDGSVCHKVRWDFYSDLPSTTVTTILCPGDGTCQLTSGKTVVACPIYNGTWCGHLCSQVAIP